MTIFAPDSSAQSSKDWQSLFNGRDLTGWTVKGAAVDQNKKFWSVDDGAIVANSLGHKDHDYNWLLTDREYGDFELSLEFQAYRDHPGNAGVQIRSRYDDAEEWLDGPQIDINPGGPWRIGMIYDETREQRTWIYPAIMKASEATEAMANPHYKFYYSDEGTGWNTLVITAVGTQIRTDLNGVSMSSYGGQGMLDNEDHQRHNVGIQGHIGLQIHKKNEVKVRYRNINIREFLH